MIASQRPQPLENALRRAFASVVSILARIAFAFCFMHTNRYANMSDTGPCMHEEKLIAKGGPYEVSKVSSKQLRCDPYFHLAMRCHLQQL